ncbi:TIGR01777 family oxidoreductase [Sutcliffiella rhizosphaerae]|uniref:Epimerase family protein n=1 Tax=Sutcliffiella rhizosphaerae TaxID=2880967 RepID=A0ABM8YSK2_9BACI|nr:TIGR01777 family oxidoreductase [Sutcliffiella rhizosphaerae]CAG9622995.1 Epimerase family protein [Sutcliffiella rhizosphaerae]
MKIAITGGTGLIGQALTDLLIDKGHSIYILTRNKSNKKEKADVTYVEWLHDSANPELELEGVDAFINLAGESINSGRWTEEQKRKIIESRLSSTKEINRIFSALQTKPKVLINASAVGFYGTSETETFTEEHTTPGTDFLASTVYAWEKEAEHAVPKEVRVVFTRFGIVLDKDEGALPKMLLPYKMFVGGKIGTGEQWMSWVHIDDVAGAIVFCLENDSIEGSVNVTAPNPKKMKEFGKTLGNVMGRPHWFPTPGFLIKTALGEMSVLVLEGQKVLPKKLENHGYKFLHSNLEDALSKILQSKK